MPVKRVYTPGLLMELSRQDQEAGDALRDQLEKKRLIITKVRLSKCGCGHGCRGQSRVVFHPQRLLVLPPQSDFAEALRNVSKSVGQDQLRRFEAWETEFGSK